MVSYVFLAALHEELYLPTDEAREDADLKQKSFKINRTVCTRGYSQNEVALRSGVACRAIKIEVSARENAQPSSPSLMVMQKIQH